MVKVASLTILAIFSVTYSCVITNPVRNIFNYDSNQETRGISNHDLQVSNNMENLLLRIMKRGCILNLGLSHNCDYSAAIGKGNYLHIYTPFLPNFFLAS